MGKLPTVLALCSIFGPETKPPKKLVALLFRANRIRSWASPSVSKEIGMGPTTTRKRGRALRKPNVQTGRNHDAKGDTRDWSRCHGGVRCWKRWSQRRTEPDVAKSGRVGDGERRLRQYTLLETQADQRLE